ncbi:MAG: DUF11 domain-containing protein, partial [Oscillospiraceae bacterium]|nr:DUF11 domain-containing protein [Oscillospiraceae bacterium]
DIEGKVTGQALRYAFDLIIVTDKSGSMWGGTPPNNRYDRDDAPRLIFLKAALQKAITAFQAKNEDNRVNWIVFGKSAEHISGNGFQGGSWTTKANKLSASMIEKAFEAYYPVQPVDPGNAGDGHTGEGTNWEAGLAKAMDLFKATDAQQKYYSSNGSVVRVPVLIFMTDGMPTLWLSGNGTGSVGGNRVELGSNGTDSYNQAISYMSGQTAMRNLVHTYSVLTERPEALAKSRLQGITNLFSSGIPFAKQLDTPKMFNVRNANELESTFKKIIDSLAEFEVLSMDDTISRYYDIDWQTAPINFVSGTNLRNTTGLGTGTYTDSKGYTYTIERVNDASEGYNYKINVSVSSSKVTSSGSPVVCSATVSIPLIVRPQYRKTGQYMNTNVGNAAIKMIHYTRINNDSPVASPKTMTVSTPRLFVGIPIFTNKEDAPNVGAPGDTVNYTFRYTNTTDASAIYPHVAAQQQTAVRLSDLLPPEVFFDDSKHTVTAKIYASHTAYTSSPGANGPVLGIIKEAGAELSEPALKPAVYADNSSGKWAQRLEFSGFALNAGQTIVITVPVEVQRNYWTYSGGANTLLDKSKVTPNGGAAIVRSTLNTASSGYVTSQGTPQTTRDRDVTNAAEEFEVPGNFTAPKYATNTITARLLNETAADTEKTLLMPYFKAYYNINNSDLAAYDTNAYLPKDQYLGNQTAGYVGMDPVRVEKWQDNALDVIEKEATASSGEGGYIQSASHWEFLGWTLDRGGKGTVYSADDAAATNDVYQTDVRHYEDVVFNAQWAKIIKTATPIQSKDDRFLNIGDKLVYEVTLENHTGSEIEVVLSDVTPLGTKYLRSSGVSVYNSFDGFVSGGAGANVTATTDASGRSTLMFGKVKVPGNGRAVAQFEVEVVAEIVNGAANSPNHLIIHNDAAKADVTLPNTPWKYSDSTGNKNIVEQQQPRYDYTADIKGPVTKNPVAVKSSNAIARGVHVGETVQYTLVFSNESTTQRDNIYLRDELPYGVEFVGNVIFGRGNAADAQAANNTYDISGNLFTAKVDNLAPGDYGFVSFDVRITDKAVDVASAPHIWGPDNLNNPAGLNNDAKSTDTELIGGGRPSQEAFNDPANGHYATFANQAAIRSDKSGTLPMDASNAQYVKEYPGDPSAPGGWTSTNYVADRVKPDEKVALTVKPEPAGPGIYESNHPDRVNFASLTAGDEFYYYLSETASRFRSVNSFIPRPADYAERVDVTIYDPIPKGLEYANEMSANGAYFSLGMLGYESQYDKFNGGYIRWTSSSTADDDAIDGWFKAKLVDGAAAAGGIKNTYDIYIGDRELDWSSSGENSVPVGEKTSDAGADGVHEGDRVTYWIRIENKESETKTITIRDRAPKYTTLVDASYGTGILRADGFIYWTIPNVAPGATAEVRFSVTVNTGAEAAMAKDREDEAKFYGFHTAFNSQSVLTEGGDPENDPPIPHEATSYGAAKKAADNALAKFTSDVADTFANNIAAMATEQFAEFAYAYATMDSDNTLAGGPYTNAQVDYARYVSEAAVTEYGRFIGAAAAAEYGQLIGEAAAAEYGTFIGDVAARQYQYIIGEAAAAEYLAWYKGLTFDVSETPSLDDDVLAAYKSDNVLSLSWPTDMSSAGDSNDDRYPDDNVTYAWGSQDYVTVFDGAKAAYMGGDLTGYENITGYTDASGFADSGYAGLSPLLPTDTYDNVVDTASAAYESNTLTGYENLAVDEIPTYVTDINGLSSEGIFPLAAATLDDNKIAATDAYLAENVSIYANRPNFTGVDGYAEDPTMLSSQSLHDVSTAAEAAYEAGDVSDYAYVDGDGDGDGLPDDTTEYPLASMSHEDMFIAAMTSYASGNVALYKGLYSDDANNDGYPEIDSPRGLEHPYAVFPYDYFTLLAPDDEFVEQAKAMYKFNTVWPTQYTYTELSGNIIPPYDVAYETDYEQLVNDTPPALLTYVEVWTNARTAFVSGVFSNSNARYAPGGVQYWEPPDNATYGDQIYSATYWAYYADYRAAYEGKSAQDEVDFFEFTAIEFVPSYFDDNGTPEEDDDVTVPAVPGGLEYAAIAGSWFGVLYDDGSDGYSKYYKFLDDEEMRKEKFIPVYIAGGVDVPAMDRNLWNVWDFTFYTALIGTNAYKAAYDAYVAYNTPLTVRNRAQHTTEILDFNSPNYADRWQNPDADANGYPWYIDDTTGEYRFGYFPYPAPPGDNPWKRTNEVRDPLIGNEKSATGNPQPTPTPVGPPPPPPATPTPYEPIFDDPVTANTVPGDEINWRIRFGNKYTDPRVVTITDSIPAHTEYKAGSWVLLRIKASLSDLLADPGNPDNYDVVVTSEVYNKDKDASNRYTLSGYEFDNAVVNDNTPTVLIVEDNAAPGAGSPSLMWRLEGFPGNTADRFMMQFTSVVLESAREVDKITNQATVTVGNDSKDTNIDVVPVGAKQSNVPLGGLYYGKSGRNEITYTISFYNPEPDEGETGSVRTIIIRDAIPKYTEFADALSVTLNGQQGEYADAEKAFVADDAAVQDVIDVFTPSGYFGNGYVEFIVPNVRPGQGGVVSFKVLLNDEGILSITNPAVLNHAYVWSYTYQSDTIAYPDGYDPDESATPKKTNQTVDPVNHEIKSREDLSPGVVGKIQDFIIDYTLPRAVETFVVVDDIPEHTRFIDNPAGSEYALIVKEGGSAGIPLVKGTDYTLSYSPAPAGKNGSGKIEITFIKNAKTKDFAVGTQFYIKFYVEILPSAIEVDLIQNTAEITIGQNSWDKIITNTVDVPMGQKQSDAQEKHPTGLRQGNQYVYTIKFKNDTDAQINSLTIIDKLPDEVKYISSNIAPATGTWDYLVFDGLGPVGIGDTKTIEITVEVTKDNSELPAYIDNHAFISTTGATPPDTYPAADGGGWAKTNETHDPTARKTSQADATGLVVGVPYTYTIRIDNPTKAATMRLIDRLPLEVDYVSSRFLASTPLTGQFKTDYNSAVRQVIWDMDGEYAQEPGGGAHYYIELTVRPNSELGAGAVENYVLKGDFDTEYGYAQDRAGAKQSVVESADGLFENGKIVYTITVTNDTSAAKDIYIYDAIPKHTTFDGGITPSINGTYTSAANPKFVHWKFENVQPGDSKVAKYSVKVNEGAYDAIFAESGTPDVEDGVAYIKNTALYRMDPPGSATPAWPAGDSAVPPDWITTNQTRDPLNGQIKSVDNPPAGAAVGTVYPYTIGRPRHLPGDPASTNAMIVNNGTG